MSNIQISQNIFEVRFKHKNFKFLDKKGALAEEIAQKFELEKLKLGGERIDLIDTNKLITFFASWENFGMQFEGTKQLNDIFKPMLDFGEIINNAGLYNLIDIGRLGAKSTILTHVSGQNEDSLKLLYRENFLKKLSEFEKGAQMTFRDCAFVFDMTHTNGKANIQTGQVTKDEALQKYFNGLEVYSNGFTKKAGVLMQIDFYQDTPETIDSDWIKKTEENFKIIFQINDSFIKFLTGNND